MHNQTNNDELNPGLMFQTADTLLLVALLSNKINLEELILRELSLSGVNTEGRWIGFAASQRLLDNYKQELELKEKRKEASKKSLAKKAQRQRPSHPLSLQSLMPQQVKLLHLLT